MLCTVPGCSQGLQPNDEKDDCTCYEQRLLLDALRRSSGRLVEVLLEKGSRSSSSDATSTSPSAPAIAAVDDTAVADLPREVSAPPAAPVDTPRPACARL